MRNLSLVALLLSLAIAGCAKKHVVKSKLYEHEFYSIQMNNELLRDTTSVQILEQIDMVKQRLVQDYNEGLSNKDKIAVRLILEQEYGGELQKRIERIAQQVPSFGKKYQLKNDCSNLSIDQALFYLTNMERDVLAIAIGSGR